MQTSPREIKFKYELTAKNKEKRTPLRGKEQYDTQTIFALLAMMQPITRS